MALRSAACVCLFALLLFSCLAGSTGAVTIHIPSGEPTLKAALVTAEDGDTLIVAPGNYSGVGFQDIDFGGKAIWLKSFKGPAATTIDCQGSVIDPHRAFWLHQGEDSTTIIEGFRFINGYGVFDGPEGKSIGGAILCDSSSPAIIDCLFSDNNAGFAGGAIACLNGSDPIISECQIIRNRAHDNTGTSITTYGGGIYCDESSPSIRTTEISDNRAHFGGGLALIRSAAVLDQCRLDDNSADLAIDSTGEVAAGYGGGLYLFEASPILTKCILTGNVAVNDSCLGCADTAIGGGLIAFGGAPVIRECTFFGNAAYLDNDELTGLGSALALIDTEAEIERSVLAFNYGRGAVACLGSDPSLLPYFTCCDIFGNQGGDWIEAIVDQLGVEGNIAQDPMFCDTAVRRLSLHQESPCAAESNSCGLRIGALDVNCFTSVDEQSSGRDNLSLATRNFPNPFNAATTIEYTVPRRSRVSISVLNLLGQTVRELTEEIKSPGVYSLIWNGRIRDGSVAATGVYFYRLRIGDNIHTRKMILLK
ncbi:MAG: T9SS type A sorting domain-containing protein [FCB group bacterium]|nr:T9SS type A sorting domain-containing protein [FCB group bacterium]